MYSYIKHLQEKFNLKKLIHYKLPLPPLTPLLLDEARVYVWTDGAAAGVGRLAGGLGTLKLRAVFQHDVVSEAAKIESWWKNIKYLKIFLLRCERHCGVPVTVDITPQSFALPLPGELNIWRMGLLCLRIHALQTA